MRWKIGIAVCLGIVIAVNVGMAWIAVSGADPVMQSYIDDPR